jgi:hypothetical protein
MVFDVRINLEHVLHRPDMARRRELARPLGKTVKDAR